MNGQEVVAAIFKCFTWLTWFFFCGNNSSEETIPGENYLRKYDIWSNDFFTNYRFSNTGCATQLGWLYY